MLFLQYGSVRNLIWVETQDNRSILKSHRDEINTPYALAYSYRNASAGFLIATLIDCTLTVNTDTATAIAPAAANTHQHNSVL